MVLYQFPTKKSNTERRAHNDASLRQLGAKNPILTPPYELGTATATPLI